jgi:hypothetical protein
MELTMSQDIFLELPVPQIERVKAQLTNPQRYVFSIILVPVNDPRVIDIEANPTDEEILEKIKKHEEETEWNDRNWDAYVDENKVND